MPGTSIIGTHILGQYRIVREIAQGGMGTIYLAEQLAMDRFAAIKFVVDRGPRAAEWRRRFRKEARAASRLVHPHIVTIYNFSELADGTLFLAMEYLQGTNLRDAIKAGPLPVRTAVTLAAQCAEALAHAHERQVIHRDFKPENIIVTEISGKDHVKVLDFGIAQIVEENVSSTESGAVLGTPRYLSPEHCAGEVSTALSDQYALGLVFYEMLTGQCAIDAETAVGFLEAHRHQQPRPPSALRSQVPPALDKIVLRMLAKEPSERFATMGEVAERLVQLARRVPTVPGPQATLSSLSAEMAMPEPRLEGSPTADGLLRTVSTLGQHPPRRDVRAVDVSGIVSREGVEHLAAHGIHLERVALDECISTFTTEDLLLADGDEASVARLTEAKIADRTLLYSEVDVTDPALPALIERVPHLTIGNKPLEPQVIATALRWIELGEGVGVERAVLGSGVQVVEVVSSALVTQYVEGVLEDAKSQGVRDWALNGLAELCEELIMNGIFHAPVDGSGNHVYADTPRSHVVELRPGHCPVLRWAVLPRFVAVSVRDPFGSLLASDVVSYLASASSTKKKHGAGKGLQIAWRAARHLIVGSAPNAWCEVLALSPREPTRERSLTLLRLTGTKTRRIGDALWIEQTLRGGVTQLEVRGHIDGSCDMSPLYDLTGRVVVDLSQVERINSAGIRGWTDVAEVGDDLQLELERCSLAVVSQLSMNPELTEGVKVISVFAPYTCKRCQTSVQKLIHVEDLDGDKPPARRCAQCDSDLEFDALPEEFFAFRL
ncbi:MAG: serine/threonine protein kinase [Myxococcales bacterium]|nr:serine/threonine protein kinase [Myxococcales bacterium]